MATGKVIKLTNNNGTPLLPITDSAYVQHKWKQGETGGTTVTSVKDALNDVIDRFDDLRLSYDTTNGIVLTAPDSSTTNGEKHGNIKLQGENITISYVSEGSVLKFTGTTNTAIHKLSNTSGKTNDSTNANYANPYLNVHPSAVASGASAVQFNGSGTSVSGQKTSYVWVTGNPSTGKIVINATYTDTNTDTKVTSAANHYKGTITTAGSYISNAANATAAWSIDVIKGFTLSYDAAGHITGLTYTSGKIPGNPVDASFVKTPATNTQLTTNAIVLGNSDDRKVKSSSYYPQTSATAFNSTSDTQIPTSKSIATWVNSQIGDLTGALEYKGTIGSSGATVTSLPASHEVGDVYVVATDGTYAGTACHVGDMIICNTKGTSANNSHWTVVPINFTVDDGTDSLGVSATTSPGNTITVATIDGSPITLSAYHSAVTTTATSESTNPKNATGSSNAQRVITGITLNNGHISGYTYTSIYSTDGNDNTAKGFFGAKGSGSNEVPRYIGPNASSTSAGTGGNTSKFIEGANVTLTPNTTNNTLTIASYYNNTAIHKLSNTSGKTNDTTNANYANPYLNVHQSAVASGASAVRFNGSGTSVSGQKTSYVWVTGNPSTGNIVINATYTDTNTHYSSKNVITSSATGTSDAATANTTTFLRHFEESTATSTHQITGANGIAVKHATGSPNVLTIYPSTKVSVVKTVSYTSGMYAVIGKDADLNDDWLTNALGTTTGTTYIVNNVSAGSTQNVMSYT